MRTIPGITIAVPLNEEELRNMMYTAQLEGAGTFSIRYPRGRGFLHDWKKPFNKLEIGKGQQLKDGSDIAIISIGIAGNFALEAADILQKEGISMAVYDMRFLKPIDEEILHTVFRKFTKIITIEDGTIVGGLGSAVLEFMADNNYSAKVKRLGIPDRFAGQGSPEELYHILGYDAEGIINAVKALLLTTSHG
jgi:1-deoxy-D-xylulose-5-phosphate synthase